MLPGLLLLAEDLRHLLLQADVLLGNLLLRGTCSCSWSRSHGMKVRIDELGSRWLERLLSKVLVSRSCRGWVVVLRRNWARRAGADLGVELGR